MRNVQAKQRALKGQKIAHDMGVSQPFKALESSTAISEMHRGGRLNEFQLKKEVTDLKKKRNKDINDTRLLKVEISKLEVLFKKYKEIMPKGQSNFQLLQIPDFVELNNGSMQTEDLLVHI